MSKGEGRSHVYDGNERIVEMEIIEETGLEDTELDFSKENNISLVKIH